MSDLTVAVASNLIGLVFSDVVDTLKADFQGKSGSGAFTLRYGAAFHFRNDLSDKPSIELRDDGTIFIHDLKVLWDKLEVTLDIDIPEKTIGGFCIFWVPVIGCVLHAPEFTLFGGHPDLSIPLALDGFVNSELSVKAGAKSKYFTNPARQPDESDWDAHANGHANHWRLGIDTPIVDFALIDIADTVADLFRNAIENEIESYLGGLPDWAKHFVMSTLGGVEWIIRTVLGIPDKIGQWIEEQFQATGGFFSQLETVAAEIFEHWFSVPLIEDPMPVLGGDKSKDPQALMPIMLPIRDPKVTVSAAEIVLEGSVG